MCYGVKLIKEMQNYKRRKKQLKHTKSTGFFIAF